MPALQLNRDLTRRILVTLAALLLVRLGIHLPLPGLDLSGIFGMRYPCHNVVSGCYPRTRDLADLLSVGGYWQGTPLALGLIPQLAALALISLASFLGPISERSLDLARSWPHPTTILTLLLAAALGYAQATGFEGISSPGGLLVPDPGVFSRVLTTASLTAGAASLLWLTRLIDKHGLGDGVLLVLFSGAALELFRIVEDLSEFWRTGAINFLGILVVLATISGLTALVLFFEDARWPRPPATSAAGPKAKASGVSSSRGNNPRGALPLVLALCMLQLLTSLGVQLLIWTQTRTPETLLWFLPDGALYLLPVALLVTLFAVVCPKSQLQPGTKEAAEETSPNDRLFPLTVCSIVVVWAASIQLAELLRYLLPTQILGPIILLLVYGMLSLMRDMRFVAQNIVQK